MFRKTSACPHIVTKHEADGTRFITAASVRFRRECCESFGTELKQVLVRMTPSEIHPLKLPKVCFFQNPTAEIKPASYSYLPTIAF